MKNYPDLLSPAVNDITKALIEEMLAVIRLKKNKTVITPLNLLGCNGAPIADNEWVLSQKRRRRKILLILKELEQEGVLLRRSAKQDFKEIKEVGYDLSE
ncbi:MAG: hypothetical protein AAFN81_21935 [Bacteroidota bacterium]